MTQIDTQNPCVYMGFAEGWLKFEGTIVYPNNRYVTLKFGGSKSIQCEDVFEHIVRRFERLHACTRVQIGLHSCLSSALLRPTLSTETSS